MPDAAQIAVQRNALLAAMQKAAMYGSQRALSSVPGSLQRHGLVI
jgi:hypothetical protein